MSGGTFSRGRWRKLKELLAAEKAASDAKTLALRATAKKKLTAAVKVARTVTEISVDDSKRITLAFDAAFGARTLADVIRQADIVLDFAKRAAEPKPRAIEPLPAQELEPEPPIKRRQLRERPNRALSPLEAVTYDIDSLLEDHRVAALERGRRRDTALARERERKRRIAERKALIARACQAHMAKAINTLIDTLNKSAIRR